MPILPYASDQVGGGDVQVVHVMALAVVVGQVAFALIRVQLYVGIFDLRIYVCQVERRVAVEK